MGPLTITAIILNLLMILGVCIYTVHILKDNEE